VNVCDQQHIAAQAHADYLVSASGIFRGSGGGLAGRLAAAGILTCTFDVSSKSTTTDGNAF
jgi:hypothetical protein